MDRRPADPAGLGSTAGGRSLLPAAADPYFRAERLRPGDEAEPSFAVLLAVEGEGTLRGEHGDALPLGRGTTALVPYAAGRTRVEGTLEAIRCLPPAPTTEEGPW
jgi:mannose-6-phosphate isomerase